jgi:hypothetical protein
MTSPTTHRCTLTAATAVAALAASTAPDADGRQAGRNARAVAGR